MSVSPSIAIPESHIMQAPPGICLFQVCIVVLSVGEFTEIRHDLAFRDICSNSFDYHRIYGMAALHFICIKSFGKKIDSLKCTKANISTLGGVCL